MGIHFPDCHDGTHRYRQYGVANLHFVCGFHILTDSVWLVTTLPPYCPSENAIGVTNISLVYFFCPETAGRTLEELDKVFVSTSAIEGEDIPGDKKDLHDTEKTARN